MHLRGMMDEQALIKDLRIQLEVATELKTEYFYELENAREYIRKCKAILDDMDIPMTGETLLVRLKWIEMNMKTAEQWVAKSN